MTEIRKEINKEFNEIIELARVAYAFDCNNSGKLADVIKDKAERIIALAKM